MKGLDRVLGAIRDEEVVELTRDLVRIPSVFRPGDSTGNEEACARYVADWMGREGFDVEVQEVAPGRPNVIALLGRDGNGPCLMFEGHTDVVTEGDQAEWSHDPFGAELTGGRIYGRGTADMKGGLAAAMVASAAIRRSQVELPGQIMVAALVDEEAGMSGVRHFVHSPLARRVSGAIICEPEENELCLEQKGVFWARLLIHGKMAHGAMPYAGVNPIGGLGWLLTAVSKLERRLRRQAGRNRYLGWPSLTPTIVRGPVAGVPQNNVIPSRAEAILDIRLIPGLSPEKVLQGLEGLCRAAEERQAGLSVKIETLGFTRPPTRVERSAPLVQAMAKAIRRVSGLRPRYGGVPGSTDGTVLFTEGGIPIVTCGPGLRQIPHQVDEYVEVGELCQAARIYAAAACFFFGG